MTEHAQLTDNLRGKLQVPTRVSCNFGTRQNLSAACRILMFRRQCRRGTMGLAITAVTYIPVDKRMADPRVKASHPTVWNVMILIQKL